MSEADLISATKWPVTVERLAGEFGLLGLKAGDLVMVHTSLRSLGWVNGGAAAVIQALLRVVGPAGTIVMPTQTAGITDPANWQAPPIPPEWIETVRATMPVFDPLISPTRQMGRVAELFRTWPGAVRSNHPASSLAALGPLASEITHRHDLDDPLGGRSPLGAMYRLGARVLLIGVDFSRCTAVHLAEEFAFPGRPTMREGAPMLVEGERRWVTFDVPMLKDSDEFLPVGVEAAKIGLVRSGQLGEGRGTIGDMRGLVDLAVRMWTA